MLNQSGITKTSGTTANQILASTNLQYSISVIFSNAGVEENSEGKKIIKAGTPMVGSLIARNTPFTVVNSSTESNVVGVALHDVDVTNGSANGGVLVFGFVDSNKVEHSVTDLYTATVVKALNKITFVG